MLFPLVLLCAGWVAGEERTEAPGNVTVTRPPVEEHSKPPGAMMPGDILTGPSYPVDENEYLDRGLLELSGKLNEWGFGMRRIIEEITIAGATVKNGAVFGLDSLHRTKTALESTEGNTTTFDVWVGARSLTIGFGQVITSDKKRMSAVFRLRGNSFHFGAIVHDPTCTFNLTHFEFETLGNVTVDSSLLEYDGRNMTNLFQEEVLPVLNKKAADNKQFVTNLLEFLCKHWKIPSNPPHVSFVIRLITGYLFQRV